MRRFWMTLLLLSVCLIALVPPMHVRGDDDETTATGDFVIKVDPPMHTVHLNEKNKNATYEVKVMALPGFQGEVELDVRGLPESFEVLFSREEGVPKPVFVSILRVEVSPSTTPGQYSFTIIGRSAEENGEEIVHEAIAILIAQGEAVITAKPVEKRLQVTVSTSEESYQKGAKVDIFGHVRLRFGESITDATVSIAVLDLSGLTTYVGSTKTDQAGRFSNSFTLSPNAVEGTYVVYVTASFAPYRDGLARTTFTVGVSDMPSIRITNVTVSKVDGTTPLEFHAGETVVVWVAVNNTGADLKNGMVWVEIIDSNDIPISVVVVIVTIHRGEQVKTGLQIVLGSDSPVGIYTVTSLVSDGPIMKGGKFLESEETAFVVA